MTKSRAVWFGWVTFAAVMLVVLGLLNVLEGLVALLQNQVTFIDGDSLVVVNLTGWGILLLVFGGLLLAAGIGLMARNAVARVAAIVIVALHMLIQIGSLGAYPVWSLLMITLSVVVLFGLTVHWSDSELPTMAPAAPAGATQAGPTSHRADRDFQAADYQGYGSGIPMNAPTSPSHPGARPSGAPAQGSTQNVGPYPPGGPYPAGRPGAATRPNEGTHAAETTGRHGDMTAPGETPQPPRYGDIGGGGGAHSRHDETARWSSDQPRHAAPTSDYGVI
ncbi:hypothetical protein [Dactylosporangium sp. NPDC005555]|uniref:DUF7144 family membrane protein n=1 Tax=Dactylosporangium sp. NPDC005555 TaxID=3154889 RepID=UPI0033B6E452